MILHDLLSGGEDILFKTRIRKDLEFALIENLEWLKKLFQCTGNWTRMCLLYRLMYTVELGKNLNKRGIKYSSLIVIYELDFSKVISLEQTITDYH
jgi:hypothetical protein